MPSMTDWLGSYSPPELPDDPRLLEAAQEFLRELEAGRRPRRQEFVERYPDLAEPLAQCLEGLELIHQAARDKPAAAVPAPALSSAGGAADTLLGSPLGDFQIVREIGRGGMGIVYEAVQLSLGRRVALKVLPLAATFDAGHLKRFQREAQAAAQLHHTNIVPVYAVSQERGVHFYAMQLIDGLSLATMIRQMRAQAGKPTDETASLPAHALPAHASPTHETPRDRATQISLAFSTQRSDKPREFFRSAARLTVQAALALDHAHESGIVHRDIKPANLLVDAQGRLWITDFGLAQFHSDVALTRTGDVLGTLRYMSPEQASGQRVQIDQRADIYSLGATLYELATLEPIFAGSSHAELLQQILNDEPRPPRAVAKHLPIELETIILKAVSKHPGDRYPTAKAFADDLERFLEDKPIHAKRPSLLERGRKWARRHPSIVIAAMLLLAVGVVGLVVSNWLISQEQAKTQAALTNEQRRAAEARRAVDLLVEVSEAEMADNPLLQDVRRRLLETAVDYYQDFIDAHGSDAAGQAELAAGQRRVRAILDELETLQRVHQLGLANDMAVAKDLELEDAQQTKIAELRTKLGDQRYVTAETRRQRFYEYAKIVEAGLNEILSAKQLARLRQIDLQLQGPRAFYDSHVVHELGLTADQKRQIRKIKQDIMAEFLPPFGQEPPGMPKRMFVEKGKKGGKGPGDDGPREPSPPDDESSEKSVGQGKPPRKEPFAKEGFGGKRPNFEEIQKREVEQILAILTAEQKNRWDELTGKPLEGRLAGPFKGPGPRPR